MGSSSEYGKIKSPHNEKNTGNPKSTYALSKLRASNILINYFNKKDISSNYTASLSSMVPNNQLID